MEQPQIYIKQVSNVSMKKRDINNPTNAWCGGVYAKSGSMENHFADDAEITENRIMRVLSSIIHPAITSWMVLNVPWRFITSHGAVHQCKTKRYCYKDHRFSDKDRAIRKARQVGYCSHEGNMSVINLHSELKKMNRLKRKWHFLSGMRKYNTNKRFLFKVMCQPKGQDFTAQNH